MSAYDMREDTFKSLSISDIPDGTDALKEKISWSDEVTIADIDGLGRCLVLICQDLQMGLVHGLVSTLRPDWVLVPILDTGTSLLRWPAQRARELAPVSEARYAIVSSLTMKGWQRKTYPDEKMGVAIGPRYINRGDQGVDDGRCEADFAPESAGRRFATMQWRAFRGWMPI